MQLRDYQIPDAGAFLKLAEAKDDRFPGAWRSRAESLLTACRRSQRNLPRLRHK